MAFGADRRDVVRLVIREGLRLPLAGLAIGLAGAFIVTRVMEHMLFDVSAVDPATFGAVGFLLAGIAVVACWLPARRAAHADPMVALRHE